MPPTVVVPLLPALSTAVPVTLLVPWADTVVSGWQEAMPLTASSQLKATVTGVRYHPAAFGLVVARPVIVGGALVDQDRDGRGRLLVARRVDAPEADLGGVPSRSIGHRRCPSWASPPSTV